ncbi:MAG: hypothetical protein ACLP7J_12255, partial [Streptosporangiaceae bacterium]
MSNQPGPEVASAAGAHPGLPGTAGPERAPGSGSDPGHRPAQAADPGPGHEPGTDPDPGCGLAAGAGAATGAGLATGTEATGQDSARLRGRLGKALGKAAERSPRTSGIAQRAQQTAREKLATARQVPAVDRALEAGRAARDATAPRLSHARENLQQRVADDPEVLQKVMKVLAAAVVHAAAAKADDPGAVRKAAPLVSEQAARSVTWLLSKGRPAAAGTAGPGGQAPAAGAAPAPGASMAAEPAAAAAVSAAAPAGVGAETAVGQPGQPDLA